MIERIERAFRENTDRPAYRTETCRLTFGQLWSLATRYAAALTDSSSPVLLIGDKEPHMVAGILACLMVSRPYVPCDSALPPERIEKLRKMTGADTQIEKGTPISETAWNGTLQYRDNSIVYMICTSGTTGEPKIVPIRARNLNAFLGNR